MNKKPSIDFEQVYDAFVATVKAQGQVWGLYSPQQEGWAVCPSAAYEDTDVLPFWSSAERAQRLCTGEWQVYQPEAIALDDFLIDWLPGMHEDDALVGPDWDVELEGLELEPADVAAELQWEDEQE